MKKIDWVRKLTSRKLWTAVASFTFCSGVYPAMERNTIFSCDVMDHAETAKQN